MVQQTGAKELFYTAKISDSPKYLLDFHVSRYFIGIAVKSEKHKMFNEQLKKLHGELPESRIL